jgi:hypothetical protein
MDWRDADGGGSEPLLIDPSTMPQRVAGAFAEIEPIRTQAITLNQQVASNMLLMIDKHHRELSQSDTIRNSQNNGYSSISYRPTSSSTIRCHPEKKRVRLRVSSQRYPHDAAHRCEDSEHQAR